MQQFLIECVDNLTILLETKQKQILGILGILLSIPENFNIIVETNLIRQIIIYSSSRLFSYGDPACELWNHPGKTDLMLCP